MKNHFYFGIIPIIAIGAAGCLLYNFTGGCMVGFSLSIFFLSTSGKFLAKKTIDKINKQIQDHNQKKINLKEN